MPDVEPAGAARPDLALITDKGFAGRRPADQAARGMTRCGLPKDEAARQGEPLAQGPQVIDNGTSTR